MKTLTIVFALVLLAACGRSSSSAKVAHRYDLSGKIVALDPQHQVATIDAAAVPNYMEAMTMDYPVTTKSDFAALSVGEQITGTLEVMTDDRYTLSRIKPRGPEK